MTEGKRLQINTKQARSIHQFQPYFDHTEEEEIRKVLESGWLIEHNATREFERLWAGRTGSKYAIATTSGSVALWLSLRAAGVGPGNEVIVPDTTFAADANAVLMCGAAPVFADVDSRGTISPSSVKARITGKTKAIIIVHLNGRAADHSLFDHKGDFFIAEDCAQSMETYYKSGTEDKPTNSSHVGNFGHVGCYSLATSKHITAGQGGVVTTNDDELYEKIFRLKDHGRFERVNLKPVEDHFDQFGFNFKFSIDASEPVMFLEDGMVKIAPIGLVDSSKEISVPALCSDYRFQWKKGVLTRHRMHSKLLRLHLSGGRKVTVTGSHSVYVIENGHLMPYYASALKAGDWVPVPKWLPSFGHLKKIATRDYLHGATKLGRTGKSHGQNARVYLERKTYSGRGLPSSIFLTKKFARFLGYYAAEGHMNRYEVRFTLGSSERGIVEEIVRHTKDVFGLEAKIQREERGSGSVHVVIHSTILSLLLHALGVGEDAHTKRVPNLVFNGSQTFKKNFIDAYYAGDGAPKAIRGIRTARAVSLELAQTLCYLFLTLGIQASISRLHCRTRRLVSRVTGEFQLIRDPEGFSVSYRVGGKERDRYARRTRIPLSATQIPSAGRFHHSPRSEEYFGSGWKSEPPFSHTLNTETKSLGHVTQIVSWLSAEGVDVTRTEMLLSSDLKFEKVLNIEEVDATDDFVYDFSVPDSESFVGGLGGVLLHNTDLAAAIGLAQMRKWEFRMNRIWKIYRLYQEWLPQDLFIDRSENETPWYVDIYPSNPEGLKARLAARGIETRRMYRPLHTQPLYQEYVKRGPHGREKLPLSRSLWFYEHGLFLPSTTKLSDDDVIRVCREIRQVEASS